MLSTLGVAASNGPGAGGSGVLKAAGPNGASTAVALYDPASVIQPYDVATRRYVLPNVGGITIEQAGAAGLASSLSTVMWDAGYVLARYLDGTDGLLGGARVVELGAGLGLPSIVAGLKGAFRVVATDGDAQCLPLLSQNARRAGASSVHPAVLDWAEAGTATALNEGRRFDVVLAADVVYAGNAGAWRPLLRALDTLATPGGTILLAQTARLGAAHEAFLQLARRRRFDVEALPPTVGSDRDASAADEALADKVHIYRLVRARRKEESREARAVRERTAKPDEL